MDLETWPIHVDMHDILCRRFDTHFAAQTKCHLRFHWITSATYDTHSSDAQHRDYGRRCCVYRKNRKRDKNDGLRHARQTSLIVRYYARSGTIVYNSRWSVGRGNAESRHIGTTRLCFIFALLLNNIAYKRDNVTSNAEWFTMPMF